MLVVTTELRRNPDRGVVVIRDTRGLRDLLAHVAAEHGCRHRADHSGFCIIDPPAWMWRLGTSSVGVGAWIADLGQWAFARQDRIREAWRTEVSADDLVERFDWKPEWLVDDDDDEED